jgi:signal transduction histidine kinase
MVSSVHLYAQIVKFMHLKALKPRPENKKVPLIGRRIFYGLLWALAGIALLWQLPIAPASTEQVYSRIVFPVLAFVLIHITDFVPFSVAGVGLVLLFLGAIFALTRVKSWLTKSRALAVLGRTILVAVAVYGAFILLWGANYRRLSVEDLLQLEPQKVTGSDISNTANKLLAVLTQTQDAPRDYNPAFASLRQAIMRQLEQVTGVAPTLPTRVKATPAGFLFAFGATGVVSPLTLEAHADSALPEPFFLATAAHELVHTAGFAGEADTDVLAALAGLQADNAYARYSVALWYFARVFNDLPTAEQQTFRAKLPEKVKTDFMQYRKAQERHAMPLVREVANFFYGGYLKSQGVESGSADYSRTGRLLASAYAKGLLIQW